VATLTDPRDERVLVVAPTGQDGTLASTLPDRAGLRVDACPSIASVVDEIRAGAGALVLAEEALGPASLPALLAVLEKQPPWSDLPVVVLATAPQPLATGPLLLLMAHGNVTLLERPVRSVTLVTTLRSALRARRRQYEVREHLVERARAVAERERLLVEAHAARDEAEALNRAKDEFLATLSHELRTPLQAMLGWTQLLRSRELDPGSAAKGLETIERNTRLQMQLIEDLLDVSRIITGKLTLESVPVSVGQVVQASVTALRSTAKHHGVTLDCREVAPVVLAGDPVRLEQVFSNLISNAIKFTASGGRVHVHVEARLGEAIVTIRDTGRGISPHALPHIFERFRQADSSITRAHGGLGLGLAIVRHIVEAHRGRVRAESEGEGKGASFTVSLPLRSADGRVLSLADTVAPLLSRTSGLPSLRGIRVLVVEDDADARELLTSVLERCGAHVTATASAAEGLGALEEGWPHVLLSDISMPGEDGYQFIRKVRALERGRAIPAIALTANARVEDRARALAAGYTRHMAKPVDPTELVHVIARINARATA
jgi:signal transduction histidine kinase/CheY-like chemotaxis protein